MKRILGAISLYGTLLSLGITLILFFFQVTDLAQTFIISLLGISISLLIDLNLKLLNTEDKVLSTINLSNQIAKDKWFFNKFKSLAKAWGKIIENERNELFVPIAQVIVEDLTDQIWDVANGELNNDRFNYRMLFKMFENTNKEIKTTSMVSLDWWFTPIGQNFWKINAAAIERNVKVTRIFLVDTVSDKLLEVMQRMTEEGSELAVAIKTDLPANLQISFAISDEKLLWISQLTQQLVFEKHLISGDIKRVQRTLEDFENIMWHAEKYDDFIKRHNYNIK